MLPAALDQTGLLQISDRVRDTGPLDAQHLGHAAGEQALVVDLAQHAALRPEDDVIPRPDGHLHARGLPPVDALPDTRKVRQIVINTGARNLRHEIEGQPVLIAAMAQMTGAARRPAALSDTTPLVTASPEQWTAVADGTSHGSATAAHQHARYHGGVAVAGADAADPVSMAGV